MQIVSKDNLHEMSILFFQENIRNILLISHLLNLPIAW